MRTLIGVVNSQDKQFFLHNHWNYYGIKGFDTKIHKFPTCSEITFRLFVSRIIFIGV